MDKRILMISESKLHENCKKFTKYMHFWIKLRRDP